MESVKESLRRLSDKDKAKITVGSFDELWVKIEPERPVRRGISPWWLAAACLIGVLIGKGIPSGETKDHGFLAVTDTIRLVERRVDTVFYEKPVSDVKDKLSVQNANSHISYSSGSNISSGKGKMIPLKSVTEDSCIVRKGKSLAEENFPLHLIVTM